MKCQHLFSLNLRFTSKENEFLPNPILNSYKTWIRLNEGASVSGEEAKLLYEKCLNYNLKHVKRGYSNGKSLKDSYSVDLDDLRMDHGLEIYGSWEQLDIAEPIKLYMKELIANGDDLFSEPRIKISTIQRIISKYTVLVGDLIIIDTGNPTYNVWQELIVQIRRREYKINPKLRKDLLPISHSWVHDIQVDDDISSKTLQRRYSTFKKIQAVEYPAQRSPQWYA